MLKLKMRGDRAAVEEVTGLSKLCVCGTLSGEAVSLGAVSGVAVVLVAAALAASLARLGGGAVASRRSRMADESDCRFHASITDQIWFQ